MANSVALSFAVATSKIPGDIIEEASKRYHEKFKQDFDAYLSKRQDKVSNAILETLPSINGLPVTAFLNRMRGVVPFYRPSNLPLAKLIEDNLDKLMDAQATQGMGPKATTFDKVQAIRKLCRLAVDPKDCLAFSNWLTSNAARLNEGLAIAVGTDHRELTQESCFAIAYLARTFRLQMCDKLDQVVASLVKAMATAFIPWEYYVEQYREAKERHNDLELTRGRPIAFHFPRMEYLFPEVNQRVLGCIYYALGDLFFSCPSPKLIHHFECRIFRRKEMTRNMLFTILHALVINLNELQTECENLVYSDQQQPGQTEGAANQQTNRRMRHFSESAWNELPANLYSDIIRVYNDRNRANKILINEIMALLRSLAPEKLPMFEEAALKALEMYAGGGSGGATRTTEPYQIGRNVIGRDGTDTIGTGSQRRYKASGQQGIGILPGIPELPNETHIVDQMESGLPDVSNMEGSESDISTDSFNTAHDRNKQGISRRTVIGPKIVDLLQPSQFYQKLE